MVENALENVWNGIINNKYEVYYQPQYNNNSGKIVGLEALARLNDSNGLVSPENFISVLEKNRMIGRLDLFVFESVCSFLKKCKDNDVIVLPISVNLSYIDFEDKYFIENLDKIRADYNIDVSLIHIEINDSLAIKDKQEAINVVSKFHDYGYAVYLDNCKGRESDLNAVRDIKYDTIKLDMWLFNYDLYNNNGKTILSVIEDFNSLGVNVLAEHIETKEQAQLLKSTDCEIVQGYYFAKPMSETNIIYLLNQSEKEDGIALLQQKNLELESYKKKFENLLEQADIYYWEYIIATKEIHPCIRSIRDFGLKETENNFLSIIKEKDILKKESFEAFCDLFNQIDKGVKHSEIIVKSLKDDHSYIVRCDSEFDHDGKPVRAYCSAVKYNS